MVRVVNIDEIYDNEVQAVVVHGDDIDKLEAWQWDDGTSSR